MENVPPLPDIYSTGLNPSYTISKSFRAESRNSVLSFLLEPSNLPIMHPLIQSVRVDQKSKSGDMTTTSMTITDYPLWMLQLQD